MKRISDYTLHNNAIIKPGKRLVVEWAIICILVLLGTTYTLAQQPNQPTQQPEPAPQQQPGKAPKVKLEHYTAPSALRLGVDLSNVVLTIIDEDLQQFEFNADVDLGRFFVAGSYGTQTLTRNETDFTYSTDGSYFRFGLDYNFLYTNLDENVAFGGFRYAQANYTDAITYTVTDDVWGTQTITNSNPDLSVRWFEFVAGMKVRIWHQLYLGYTVRLKFSKQIKGADELTPFDIPGFGRANQSSNVGINYHVFYRIKWRNNKPIPPKREN